jgi:hypothetical protein
VQNGRLTAFGKKEEIMTPSAQPAMRQTASGPSVGQIRRPA